MQDFYEWINEAGLSGFLPNLGQRAIPINQTGPRPGQAPATQPQKISLSTFANQVTDPNWLSLYDKFTQQFQRAPQDPKVKELGMALYQAASKNDMSVIQPFVQQHLWAQKVQ